MEICRFHLKQHFILYYLLTIGSPRVVHLLQLLSFHFMQSGVNSGATSGKPLSNIGAY